MPEWVPTQGCEGSTGTRPPLQRVQGDIGRPWTTPEYRSLPPEPAAQGVRLEVCPGGIGDTSRSGASQVNPPGGGALEPMAGPVERSWRASARTPVQKPLRGPRAGSTEQALVDARAQDVASCNGQRASHG